MNLAKTLLELGRGVAHPFAQFGTAAAYTPKAVYRLAQNKPIDDIQRRVFGTNDQGAIARSIIGNTAQIGLTAAIPAQKGVSALQGLKTGSQLGAAGGVASGFADSGNPLDMLQRGVMGGALGGLIGGAGPLGRAMFLNKSKTIPVKNTRLLDAVNERRYQLERPNNVKGSQLNATHKALMELKDTHGIDLRSGSANEQKKKIMQFLEQNGDDLQDGAMTQRMWTDYFRGNPPVKGSGLSGEGATAVSGSLSSQARRDALAKKYGLNIKR